MNEKKRKYRVTNWRAYNAALVSRGSLTVWLDEAAVAGWHEAERTSGAEQSADMRMWRSSVAW